LNIFIETQRFYVGMPLHAVVDTDENFLQLALKIRQQLGERAFKLDEYLATILNAANLWSVQQASEDAEVDFADIRSVCKDIIDDENALHDHECYPALKEYIDKNRSRFQERYTLIIMACAAVAPEFMVCMAKRHFDSLAEEYNKAMDVVELRHIYRELTYAVGEQDVDRLNELIKRRFFISMAGDVYLQALTEQYLMELQYRDKETSRQIIQIMLDDAAKAPE